MPIDQPIAAAAAVPADSLVRSANPASGVFLLALAHFLNDGASSYLPGVLPAVLVELHIRLALVGTVMAALMIGQAFQPLWGWLEDQIGGRWFTILGVTGSTVGGAVIGLVPGYFSLAAVLLLIGTSSAVFHPQALAGVRTLPTRRPGLTMSAFLLGGQLGFGAWPLLSSLVVAAMGLRALPLLAIPAALSLPVIAFRVPALPRRHPDLPRLHFRGRLVGLTALILYVGLGATVQFSLTTFLPIMWVNSGGSLVGGASLITVLLLSGIFGNLAGGHLSDRFGRRPVLVVSKGLAAALMVLLIMSQGITLWVVIVALGAVLFSSNPVQILVGQDILPENRSVASGIAMGFSNALGALVMVGLGVLAARWNIPMVLWINVALCAAAIVVAMAIPKATHVSSV